MAARERVTGKDVARTVVTTVAGGVATWAVLRTLSTLTIGARGDRIAPEVQARFSGLSHTEQTVLAILNNPALEVRQVRVGNGTQPRIYAEEPQPQVINGSAVLDHVWGALGRFGVGPRRKGQEHAAVRAATAVKTNATEAQQHRAVQTVRVYELTHLDPIEEITSLTQRPEPEAVGPVLSAILERALPFQREDISHPGLGATHVAQLRTRMEQTEQYFRAQHHALEHTDAEQARVSLQAADLIHSMMASPKDKPGTSFLELTAQAIQLGFLQEIVAADLTSPQYQPIVKLVTRFLEENYPGSPVDPTPQTPTPVAETGNGAVRWIRRSARRFADAVLSFGAPITAPNQRADLLQRLTAKEATLTTQIAEAQAAVTRLEASIEGQRISSRRPSDILTQDLANARERAAVYQVQLGITSATLVLFRAVNYINFQQANNRPLVPQP